MRVRADVGEDCIYARTSERTVYIYAWTSETTYNLLCSEFTDSIPFLAVSVTDV